MFSVYNVQKKYLYCLINMLLNEKNEGEGVKDFLFIADRYADG